MTSTTQTSTKSAFTLPELMLGLAITSIVLAALTGMSLGMAQSWMVNDGTQSVPVQSNQVYNRVRHYLSSAKYVVQTSGNTLCYWAVDDWLGNADEAPEAGEMAMIQLDTTTQTLWLYQPIAYAAMTSAQQAAAGQVMSYATLSSPAWITTFKTLNYVQPTAIGRNISAASFDAQYLTSTTQRPVVEYSLTVTRPPAAAVTQYQTVTLRAPTTQPS